MKLSPLKLKVLDRTLFATLCLLALGIVVAILSVNFRGGAKSRQINHAFFFNRNRLNALLDDYYLKQGYYPDSLVSLRKYIFSQWAEGIYTLDSRLASREGYDEYALYNLAVSDEHDLQAMRQETYGLNYFLQRYRGRPASLAELSPQNLFSFLAKEQKAGKAYAKDLLSHTEPLGIKNPLTGEIGYGRAYADLSFVAVPHAVSADAYEIHAPYLYLSPCSGTLLYAPIAKQQGYLLAPCSIMLEKSGLEPRWLQSLGSLNYQGKHYTEDVQFAYDYTSHEVSVLNLKAYLRNAKP
jgi:hypothetical protein